ncbi:MAG: carboxypeptidase regulatory-like domain-containing protein [Chitinophagales bacterium]
MERWYYRRKTIMLLALVAVICCFSVSVALAEEPPAANVLGHVTKGQTPVTNICFSLHTISQDALTWYQVTTGETGAFSLFLPDGSYQVDGIYVDNDKTWYPLYRQFDVSGGSLILDPSQNELLLDLLAPCPTPGRIQGVVKDENGDAVPFVRIRIVSANPANTTMYGADANAAGQFGLDLENGDYVVQSISSYQMGDILLNQQFTINDTNLELVINLPPITLRGQLVAGTESVPGVDVNIHRATENGEQWYWIRTDAQGLFNFRVPDGSYRLDGVWLAGSTDADAGQWKRLDRSIVVSGGTTDPSPVVIDIIQEAPISGNVQGHVVKGEIPIANVCLNVHTIGEPQQWYGTQTNNQGAFGFELADGDYQADGVWVDSEQLWYPLMKKFTVTGGQLLLAEGQTELLLDLLAPVPISGNVQGHVLKGAVPVGNVWVNVHTMGDNQQWYGTQTNSQGAFGLDLADGDYQADGIWLDSEQQWYPLAKQFSISGGQLVLGEGQTELLLDLLAPIPVSGNVKGIVKDAADNVFPDVWVQIKDINSDPANCTSYGASTNRAGEFGLDLPAGTYEIVDIGGKDGVIQIRQQFTVTDQAYVTVIVPGINLYGKLVEGLTPLAGIDVNLHRKEGTDDRWYWTKTDDQGNFALRAPEGTYRLDGIWLPDRNEWKNLNYPVTVPAGTADAPFVIDITQEVPISGNVQGHVVKGQTPVGNVWVNVHTMGEMQQWYGTQTNSQGAFGIDLADGDYQADGIWVDNEQQWYPLAKQFSVSGGQLVLGEGQTELLLDLLASIPVTGRVQGTVKDENGNPVEFAKVTIGMVNSPDGQDLGAETNAAGEFALDLSNGDYIVKMVENRKIGRVILNQALTINDENLAVQVVLPSASLKGQVKYDQNPIPGVEVNIHTQSNSTEEWWGVTTDEQGGFSFRVPDGVYLLDGIWLPAKDSTSTGQWKTLNLQITVANQTTDPSPYVIDLAIEPPVTGNVCGSVVKGVDPMGNIGFSIHTTDGDKTQWTWYQASTNNQGAFGLDLPDGNYQIDGIWDDQEQIWYPLGRTFSVSGGILVQTNGETTINIVLPVIIHPQGRVQGLVKDSSGNAVGLVQVSIKSTDPADTTTYSANCNEIGEFALDLQNGEYRVETVTLSGGEQIPMDQVFTISDDKLRVDVILPPKPPEV